jgi:hypothetical protein
MFDTNSSVISIGYFQDDEYRLWRAIANDNDPFYEGSKNNVQAMFDRIVTAEKRGDTFFEISN